MNKASLTRGDLAYVDRGDGIPILLLHGFPLDHTMWDAQIGALAQRARVIAPDIRGFGESPLAGADPEHGIPMEQHADELAELLDFIGINQPAVVVGFSMGGYIAWQFVRKHSRRIRALVQCDTRAIADSDEARGGRIKMADNVADWGSERVAEMMGPKLFSARALETRPELMAEVRRVVKNTSPAAIAAAQRGMAERPDATALLPTIQVPTLVLVGSEDAISTPAEMRTIAEAIPNAQFVEIPMAGHMTTMERPEEVSQALLAFVRDFA
jgi:pimeloyl-ACP methyl ester carboxylesterase